MDNIMITGRMKSGKLLLALTGILIVLSYGSITTRGGYADDFAFLAYSSTHSYIDAVLGWSSTFNSRISQGAMMPLLQKWLTADTPDSIHWTAIHAAGLLALMATVFLLYKTMQLFRIPWQASITALLIFSLNPIKSEALLWPATIIGYIFPLFIFTLATWFYFRNAKQQQETPVRLIISALLFIFCLFAIEQLPPLFFLVLAMRLVFFKTSRRQLVVTITGALLITIIYVLVTFSGRTSERLDQFTGINPSSIVAHSIDVLRNSLTDLIVHTPRTLIDPYFHSELLEAGHSAAFMLAILTIAVLMIVLFRRLNDKDGTVRHTDKQLLLLFTTGALIYLATISPFMLLSYYIAIRALYIPSLGIALMAGAMFAFLAIRARHKWQNMVLTGSLAIILVTFILVNTFSQNDFSRQWLLEQDVLDYVSSVKNDIPEHTEISIFNMPETYGPSPGFVNSFGFNGIVNWIAPGKGLYGETQKDFSEVFEIPETIEPGGNLKLQPMQGKWVLVWTPEGVMRVTGLRLHDTVNSEMTIARDRQAEQPGRTAVSGDLYGVVSTPGQSAVYSGEIQVTVKTLINIPQIDTGLVQIQVTGQKVDDVQPRLILHARNRNDHIQPYDTTVSLRNGFQPVTAGYNKYFLISDISSIKTLRISLTSKTDNLIMLEKQNSATASNTSKTRVPATAQPGKTTGILFF